MSLRLETLQVARMAPSLLRDSSELVRAFVLSGLDDAGGFRDRDGRPDLYYTVFGLECLLALREDAPRELVGPWLRSFGAGEELDFVHLCCLVRAWASLGEPPGGATRARILERVREHRSDDGGYGNVPRAETGTVYGCFLALGAFQDLDAEFEDAERVCEFLGSMETADGGYANDPWLTVGTTPTTAAAVGILRQLRRPVRPAVAEWLEAQVCLEGGFRAMPRTPLPDLLSTATALHALSGLERSVEPYREACLDFVDTLWTNEGGFHGHWADDHLDCEYTFYGLLALGHLSV